MGKYIEVDKNLVYKHYNRKEILDEILRTSQNKEVAGSFGGQGYPKRPDILEYPQDILEQVKRGVTSFHASEELWRNPLSIETNMSKDELANLRIGWDLILDIDCKELEYSKVATHIIIQTLKFYGLKNISCKFSGNHGFHIAVPFEAFPTQINNQPTARLFPQAPRAIATYIKYTIERSNQLHNMLLELEKKTHPGKSDLELVEIIREKADLTEEKMKPTTDEQIFNPFSVIEIDTILLTSRHLYRHVYSVNEKSGLISIPINPEKVLQFDKSIADINKHIVSKFKFLDREITQKNEGAPLLVESFDYLAELTRQEEQTKFYKELTQKENVEYEEFLEKIPQNFFPQTITELLGVIKDGKKRAIFILQNFLRCANYTNEEVEAMLKEWNRKQNEPLRDTYFQGQMSHFKRNTEKILPPNYQNSVYEDILGKKPAHNEAKFKNPVACAKIRYKTYLAENKRPKKKTSENVQGKEKIKKNEQIKESKAIKDSKNIKGQKIKEESMNEQSTQNNNSE